MEEEYRAWRNDGEAGSIVVGRSASGTAMERFLHISQHSALSPQHCITGTLGPADSFSVLLVSPFSSSQNLSSLHSLIHLPCSFPPFPRLPTWACFRSLEAMWPLCSGHQCLEGLNSSLQHGTDIVMPVGWTMGLLSSRLL